MGSNENPSFVTKMDERIRSRLIEATRAAIEHDAPVEWDTKQPASVDLVDRYAAGILRDCRQKWRLSKPLSGLFVLGLAKRNNDSYLSEIESELGAKLSKKIQEPFMLVVSRKTEREYDQDCRGVGVTGSYSTVVARINFR